LANAAGRRVRQGGVRVAILLAEPRPALRPCYADSADRRHSVTTVDSRASSHHVGGSPLNSEARGTTDALLGVQSDVVPFQGRPLVSGELASPWADVLSNLRSAEFALSKLESSHLFGTFTGKQKGQYYQALGEVQTLIREISNETSQHRIAS